MTVSAERLAKVFVEVADTLVAEFDVIEFMQMLAHRAVGVVDASAVGLLLADQHGKLHFMAASDENTKLLELFQVQSQDGPCLDVWRDAIEKIGRRLERLKPMISARSTDKPLAVHRTRRSQGPCAAARPGRASAAASLSPDPARSPSHRPQTRPTAPTRSPFPPPAV